MAYIDTLQARVRDLEGAAATRKGCVQEDIAKSLAGERLAHAILIEREKGQLQVEISLLCEYIGILISEMMGHRSSYSWQRSFHSSI